MNDWINQTGQGIIDEGGDITDAVNKWRSFYYTLERINRVQIPWWSLK
jgi:hypothetical protein